MRFEKLFEPLFIGKVPIKNRIAMSGLAIRRLEEHGGYSQRAMYYYGERARGGVGLICTGVTRVTDIEPTFGYVFVSRESFSSFAELAELVHYYGARIFGQFTAGNGRNTEGRFIDSGLRPFSPSEQPTFWRPNMMTRALTVEQIAEIVNAFGNAAELLKAAGFDGVELVGYVFDEFTTTIWNRRSDRYGGSLENRLRFPIECLNAIKDKAGKDFPVVYRYSVKHYMKGPKAAALGDEDYIEAGRDLPEGIEMARLLEEAGFDALDLMVGSHDSPYWCYPPGYLPHVCWLNMTAEVKKAVKVPVIVAGRNDIAELAERALREEKTDMVALGRALLADPQWPKKVREGRIDDIRPCIGCNQCQYRMSEGKPLSCAVNPAVGKEKFFVPEAVGVDKSKKVLIAGGGIGGMEAARSSALNGYEVVLYERGEQLGGHMIAGSVPEFKQDIRRLLDWYKTQLQKLEVEIGLQVEVTPELIQRERPDRVIVATGSKMTLPRVSGIESPMVTTCIDLLLGKRKAGDRVVVIGGGLVGCESALWLANQGKRVTIVETLPEMAVGGLFFSVRFYLIDMLRKNGVQFVNNARLDEVGSDSIGIVENDHKKKDILCDTVALAFGLESRRELYESLRKEGIEVFLIGDCKEPGKIINAIWDAYHVANTPI